MTETSLNRKKILVNDGMQAIVVVKDLGDIPGGRSLDVSGVASGTEVIKAGHVIIYDGTKKSYLPMPLNDDANGYASLPEGCSYAGVLKATVAVGDARAAILTIGQVNAAASPYTVTDDIKEGLPQIQFIY